MAWGQNPGQSLRAVFEELSSEVLEAVAPAAPPGLHLLDHHAVEETDEFPRVATQPVEHLVAQQVAELALLAAQAHFEQLEVAEHEEVQREAVVAPGCAAVEGRQEVLWPVQAVRQGPAGGLAGRHLPQQAPPVAQQLAHHLPLLQQAQQPLVRAIARRRPGDSSGLWAGVGAGARSHHARQESAQAHLGVAPGSAEGPLAPVLQEEVDDALLAHVNVVLDAAQLGGGRRPARQLLGPWQRRLAARRLGRIQDAHGLARDRQAVGGDGGARLAGAGHRVVLLEDGLAVRPAGRQRELPARAARGLRALGASLVHGAEVPHGDAALEDLARHGLAAPAERMRAAQAERAWPPGGVNQQRQRLARVGSQELGRVCRPSAQRGQQRGHALEQHGDLAAPGGQAGGAAVHAARVDGEARRRQGGRDGQQLLQLQLQLLQARL
ncbi:uncharacterized protein LOC123333688 isoform X2 [Bubalus bubalis]|uniref:uncharacterized protein LOC123333688 isoform X2 n=1 Tax=Bubalus bubalis TaxID=89462 RepID=UPI001D100513|nr:uncharacterized protein LOC123333688 isoform X2 [Bubalus bubalis]